MAGVEDSDRDRLKKENRSQEMVFNAVIFPYCFPLRPELQTGFCLVKNCRWPANGYGVCVPELRSSNVGTRTEDSSVLGCDAVSHLVLNVMTVSSSKISVGIDQPTQHGVQEDWSLHQHGCVNLKSCTVRSLRDFDEINDEMEVGG
jgi:hypothetical protein